MKIDVKATLNLEGFEALRKGLQRGQYVGVGIFQQHKDTRKGDGISNTELAVIHEFGSISNNIPARSFIRMPLQEKRKEILAFAASSKMSYLLLHGQQKKALQYLGLFAEEMIQLAFDTGGFGKWAKNTWATVQKKHSGKPLIDTSQLRRAVWSKVFGI